MMMSLALIVLMGPECSGSTLHLGHAHEQKPFTPASIVRQFFISTSAEYNSDPPQIWDRFVQRMQNEKVLVCMTSFGFKKGELRTSTSSGPISFGVDNIDYPDVTRLRQGNLGLAPRPNTGATSTSPVLQTAIFQSDYQRCQERSLAMFATVDEILHPMFRTWDRDMSILPRVRAVVKATKKWSECVALRGAPASSPAIWFATLDRLIRTIAKTTPDAYTSPRVVARVRVYGYCVVTLARAMDRVRLGDRARLLKKFGQDLPVLAKQMNELISSND